MHCKSFGLSENLDMHSLKQVYLYGYMCWLVWNESSSKLCIDLDFQKTVISSNLFYPGKPNSKSKHVLGLSVKAKV